MWILSNKQTQTNKNWCTVDVIVSNSLLVSVESSNEDSWTHKIKYIRMTFTISYKQRVPFSRNAYSCFGLAYGRAILASKYYIQNLFIRWFSSWEHSLIMCLFMMIFSLLWVRGWWRLFFFSFVSLLIFSVHSLGHDGLDGLDWLLRLSLRLMDFFF